MITKAKLPFINRTVAVLGRSNVNSSAGISSSHAGAVFLSPRSGRGGRGENSPNDSRIERPTRECGASILPLLAKRGEGWGEEHQGAGGNLHVFSETVADRNARASAQWFSARIKRGILTLFLTASAALPLLAQTATQDFPAAAPFELGDSGFLPGDSITIQELRGTSDVIQPGGTYSVTGTYTLTSHNIADLCFFATTTNASATPIDPAQRVHLTK